MCKRQLYFGKMYTTQYFEHMQCTSKHEIDIIYGYLINIYKTVLPDTHPIFVITCTSYIKRYMYQNFFTSILRVGDEWGRIENGDIFLKSLTLLVLQPGTCLSDKGEHEVFALIAKENDLFATSTLHGTKARLLHLVRPLDVHFDNDRSLALGMQ